MILGVDVGGTHTDAVLLEETRPGLVKIIALSKAPTKERAIDSLTEVFNDLLDGSSRASSISRLTVSTTLGLNSVLTGTSDPVGLLTTSGPGLELEPDQWGPLFKALSGQQDHRGHVIVPQDPAEARKAAEQLIKSGALALVAASKFGPKNLQLENILYQEASQVCKGPVMAASRLFGGLNFPRRLGGAFLNASVKRLYDGFLDDLIEATQKRGLNGRLNILKADGGVMDLEAARERPVLALAAGPAASLLGLWALSGNSDDDVLMIDMGGTSTDLAILSLGKPLLTPSGLTLAGRPTLVRGLFTHSIALGGDSVLDLQDGRLMALPSRCGSALALAPKDLGQRPPTLTDAFNVMGLCSLGQSEVSLKAIELICPGQAKKAASEAIETALERLGCEVKKFIKRVNQQPVYTISEFLIEKKISPRRAVILGGPAETIAPLIERVLAIPCLAPAGAATANALGAALAKPTLEAELYADTDHGTLSVPVLNVARSVKGDYNLNKATMDLMQLMGGGSDLRVVAAESFNQTSGHGRSGKIIRVAVQSEPGLSSLLEGAPEA